MHVHSGGTVDKASMGFLRCLSFATHDGELLEREKEGASREVRGREAELWIIS